MNKGIENIRDFDVRNKDLWIELVAKATELRVFLIGLTVLIGSFGLLTGALTCAIASNVMVYHEISLAPPY